MKPIQTALKTTLTSLILALAVAMPATAQAPTPVPVPAPAQPAQIAPIEHEHLTLRHQFELLTKDFERLQSETDRDLAAQKERISDLHASADWLGLLMALITIVFALGAGFSFVVSTRRAVSEAKDWLMEDAKKETKQLSADLVQHSMTTLEPHIKELEQDLKSKIEEHVTAAKKQFDDMMADVDKKHHDVQDTLARVQEAIQKGDGAQVSNADKNALDKAAQASGVKPEDQRKYLDWSVAAIQAFLKGNYVEAAKAYDRAAQSSDATQIQVAESLFNKSSILLKDDRSDEALAALDEVVARFGESEELALREWVAKALVNKSAALNMAGRPDEALVACDAVEARFGMSTELALREAVARALVNKGTTLNNAGHPDEALAAYEAVEARFGGATELVLREQVTKALFSKGVALNKAERTDEALAAYDAVEARFGMSTELALREAVARALVNKGVALGKAGRTGEELAAYDAVVARFGGAAELVLREQVAIAQGNRGFARLTLAKKAGQTAQGAGQAQGLLMTALADVGAALGVQPDYPIQLGNKAYALFLLGREAEAEAPLRRALELGGEEAYKNEMDDAQIHPLPQDSAFVALVERLWAEVQAAKKEGKEGGEESNKDPKP
jgi:tetratricopeptide (TPR) repeat protein